VDPLLDVESVIVDGLPGAAVAGLNEAVTPDGKGTLSET
jgi:hypothetical protein